MGDSGFGGDFTSLSDIGYSYFMIMEQCKKKGFVISRNGISCALKRHRTQDCSSKSADAVKKRKRRAPARPKDVVQKIKKLVEIEHPKSQRAIASKLGMSLASVNRVIRQDLNLERRPKAKVHYLNRKHIVKRRTTCRKLYERYLAGDKWKFVVTLDEAWVYLHNDGRLRAIYYRKRGERTRPDWVKQCKEAFPKGFMVVAGYCHRGMLTIRKVPTRVKINAAYYQQYVLNPIYSEDIPRLYGGDVTKVLIHQDQASSHTAKSTVQYCERMRQETGIGIIPFDDIPVKSPDAAPMDFCAFGLLKRAINQRQHRTESGLWKTCKEEWAKLDLAVLRKSLLQWKVRCRAIARRKGHHIEHNRWWRNGFS